MILLFYVLYNYNYSIHCMHKGLSDWFCMSAMLRRLSTHVVIYACSVMYPAKLFQKCKQKAHYKPEELNISEDGVCVALLCPAV